MFNIYRYAMMKKIFFFTLIVLFSACNQPGKFQVSGSVADSEGKTLYFEQTKLLKDSLIDSVKLNANGNFKFKSTLPGYPDLYRLKLDGQQLILGVDSTTKTIEINASGKNMISADIKGSLPSVEIQKLRKSVVQLQAEAEVIMNEKDNEKQKQLFSVFQQNIDKHKKSVKDMILKNPRSIVAYFALYQQVSGSYIFSPYRKEDRPYYSAVATSFSTFMPNYERSQNLYNFVIDAFKQERMGKQQEVWQELQKNSSTGFIDFELKDNKNVAQKLSSYKGKVIVLDFSVCEAETSVAYTFELREIYNKFAGRGLQIYQVSLDQNKMLWEKSVANLPWVCTRDVNGNVMQMYNVQEIPTLYLIDKSGTIVGRYNDVQSLSADLNKVI